ncbi:MAG: hypothetical protein ABR562_07820 [Thermoplasmatota archaeon]
MKTTALLAILLTTALAAAGAASIAALRLPIATILGDQAGADMAAMHGGIAGDDPHAQLGMDRPRFPPAAGSVPTADQARHLKQVSRITISKDSEFNPANGVSSGTGTLADPYRITGLDVTGDLYIADTDACFEVVGNWVDGQLILNWDGQCVWVHHNFVRDLRVNENVQRTGIDTGGLIELNQINYVGQIRHYDGEFRDNVVGPRQDAALPFGVFQDPENLLPFAQDTRVLNIDGWNEALFHHNTIYGSTDLKLHGHHHSTGFLASHSHYHGDGKAPHPEDHTARWESVSFQHNQIVDPQGYGLRYSDEQHAGDDRTAPSESNTDLEKPHQHHTLVDITGNTLDGAGIWVDILNADDELHTKRDPAWFTIADNTVSLTERHPGLLGAKSFGQRYEPNTAIWIWQSKEGDVKVTGNTMTFQKAPSSDPLHAADPILQAFEWWSGDETPTAVHLLDARDGAYTVAGNHATGFDYGVRAANMDEKANWAVYDDDWGAAANPVYYDDTVQNKPSESPLPAGPGPYDDAPAAAPAHAGHHHG